MRNTLPIVSILTLVLLLILGGAPGLQAAEEKEAQADSTEELAKKTQNPVADLISVPFQSDFNFVVGPTHGTQYVLNIQPVIPIHLTADWNLITRTILPVIYQPELSPGTGPNTGLGDLNPTFFLSPAKSGALIWGVGPTFTFPTATDTALGSGKWSAGPAGVVLSMQGPWVLGVLANQQWSFAGDAVRRSVSQLLIQPFVNYNLQDGWYLVSAPILTANWMASSGDVWTVPLGGGVGKLWRVGKVGLPINTQLQAFYNVATPEGGADWQLRFQVQVLLPE
jgi:hypothetical protein